MSFIAKVKASLGDAILKGQMSPTTATSFTTIQKERWTGQVTAVASQITSIGIRIFCPSNKAAQLYGFTQQPGDFIIFNIPWNQTQAITADDLAAAINAAAADTESPLYSLVTASTTGGGAFVIQADHEQLVMEFVNLVRVTLTKTLAQMDLATDNGDAILLATVSDGSINYTETGVAPTAGVGLEVTADNPFDIIGVANILNAQVIETSGADPATVNYQIYRG